MRCTATSAASPAPRARLSARQPLEGGLGRGLAGSAAGSHHAGLGLQLHRINRLDKDRKHPSTKNI